MNTKLLKEVYITTNFVGFHQWPNAPIEVAFLRDLHRHVFGVKVCVLVNGSDREVEFFTLKQDVDKAIRLLNMDLEQNQSMSCEMMAEWLIEALTDCEYKVTSVEVNEDGENGAILTAIQEVNKLKK